MDIYKTSVFKYIAGDMLVGRPITLTIDRVEIEEIITPTTGEVTEKPILFFKESKRPLILNKTNAAALAKVFGRETDQWTGKAVELFAETVKAFGKVHNAARVRVAKIQQQTDRIKGETLTQPQRQARRSKNTEELRGPVEDSPIGETPALGQVQDAAPEAVEEFTF